MDEPRYLPAGESALVVEYGTTDDPALHARVLALDAALAAHPIEGVRETVPTYRSLMIHFDPQLLSMSVLVDRLSAVAMTGPADREPQRWCIPACYDAPYGEDLEELTQKLSLEPERIADLHSNAQYRVVMYGFAPGFLFLSGLPAELKVSRRETPRAAAPPGALTIANGQALIASIAMPTGWYMIGRTPARTFDPARDPVFPIGVGDEVTFQRVDSATFEDLEKRAESGEPILEAI